MLHKLRGSFCFVDNWICVLCRTNCKAVFALEITGFVFCAAQIARQFALEITGFVFCAA